MKNYSLRKALKNKKLDKFIKQIRDKIGNSDKFNLTLDSMLKKKKLTRQTSSEDSSEN